LTAIFGWSLSQSVTSDARKGLILVLDFVWNAFAFAFALVDMDVDGDGRTNPDTEIVAKPRIAILIALLISELFLS